MKATIKSLKTVLITMLFLTGTALTVFSQKAIVFNDIESTLSQLRSEVQPVIVISAESTRNYYDFYYEPMIELEDWMLDGPAWTIKESSRNFNFLDEDNDAQLVLEYWMLGKSLAYLTADDNEKELVLEDWMTDLTAW